MPIEKSAGAVIFRKEGDEILYLLLHYASLAQNQRSRTGKNYWDFPKGHIEPGETEGKTVRREVEEETGLTDIKFIPKFHETIKYFFKWEGQTIFKTVIYYLLETKTKDIKISDEHIGFIWLSYEEAAEKLTFDNGKEILKKANDYISKEDL